MSLTIVLPEISDDEISAGLRRLTAAIARSVPDEDYGYGLGGEHGYGANFENDVFQMRRFYWGECDCGFNDAEDAFAASYDGQKVPWDKFDNSGHTPQCALELPNFRHKASGFEVRWYKYIGRGMEFETSDGVDFDAILRECISSLSPVHNR